MQYQATARPSKPVALSRYVLFSRKRSATGARELGLVGHGLLAVDAVADLVVLDDQLAVVQTYIGGELVYARS